MSWESRKRRGPAWLWAAVELPHQGESWDHPHHLWVARLCLIWVKASDPARGYEEMRSLD